MKSLIMTLVIALAAKAGAADKPKGKPAVKPKEDIPRVDPVPGGIKADSLFYEKWRDMIEPAKFPQLPLSSKLEKDASKLPPQDDRQRYIFQMDTASVDLKNEIWDEGYYYYAYSNKEQGNLMLVVHPKYRKCFDNLKKKFDFMQWVVFEYGELVGRKQIVLETPRQCLGDFKYTGSKLPTAKGDLDP